MVSNKIKGVKCWMLGTSWALEKWLHPFIREEPMSCVFSHVYPKSGLGCDTGLASSADVSGPMPGMH